MGQAAIAARHPERALAPLERSLAILRDLPASPDRFGLAGSAQFYLGEAQQRLSRRREALDWYRQALATYEGASRRGMLSAFNSDMTDTAVGITSEPSVGRFRTLQSHKWTYRVALVCWRTPRGPS